MRVLIVEDSPTDLMLLRRVLAREFPWLEVHHEADGIEAREYLLSCASTQSLPGLVLLDLGLPGLSGAELLLEIQGAPELRSLYVVVMASSPTAIDIVRSQGVQPDAFIEKPVGSEQLGELLARRQSE